MLWSTNRRHDGSQYVNQARSAKMVLGFNEPGRGDQANMNPNQQVSQQKVDEFMRQSVAQLDSLSWVERYAWFGAQRQLDAALGSANCLIAPNGQLSALG